MMTKREQKAQATRQKILDVACYGFTVKPMNLISLDVVAYRAKVDRSTIYRYFSDKKILFAAVVEEERIRVIRAMQSAAAHEQTGTKKLEAYFRTRFKNKMRLMKYLSHNLKFIYGNSEIWGSFCEFADDERKHVERILRFGHQRAEFVVDETESLAKSIVDLMDGLQTLHIERGKALDEIQESAMKIAEIISRGVRK